MRKVSVSSTLTVFHDGQFWVRVIEHFEDGKLAVKKIAFGAEPSNEEILQFVNDKWSQLHFSKSIIIEAVLPRRAAKSQKTYEGSVQGYAKSEPFPSKLQRGDVERARKDERGCQSVSKQNAPYAKTESQFEQRTAKRKRKHKGK